MTDDEAAVSAKGRPDQENRSQKPCGAQPQPWRKPARLCRGITNCIPICPIQAKYDPTVTLNDAMDTGYVTMPDRTVASEIVVGENGDISQINFGHKGGHRRCVTNPQCKPSVPGSS